jgi:hypothetical protein
MRRISFLIVALLLLCSVDVFAQCKKCEVAWGCLTCAETYYNANVLCTISGNGSICVGQGQCDGLLGECKKGCALNQANLPAIDPRLLDTSGDVPESRLAEISQFGRFVQTDRQWQLVSVKLTRVKARS